MKQNSFKPVLCLIVSAKKSRETF